MLVAGAGISGLAAAAALVELGARVTVDRREPAALTDLPAARSRATGEDLPPGTAAHGHRPGPPPRPPARRGRGGGRGAGGRRAGAGLVDRRGARPEPPTWLVVTGTNGKTTTTGMLEAILRAAGLDAVACGNIGYPVVDAVRAGRRVLAVELSSFQLHWSPSVVPAAGCVLNVAEDHLDWHGSMAAYAAAKARALRGPVAVAGVDDPAAAALLAAAPAARRVGVTLGEPAPGQLGIVEGVLVDRAFSAAGRSDAALGQRADAACLAGRTGRARPRACTPAARPGSPTRSPPPRWPVPPVCAPEARRGRARRVPARPAPRATSWRRSPGCASSTTPRRRTRTPQPRRWPRRPPPRWSGSSGGLLKGASVDELVARHAGGPAGGGGDRHRPARDRRRAGATRAERPRRGGRGGRRWPDDPRAHRESRPAAYGPVADGRRRSAGPPRWPAPVTSSCSPRPRRRWTSSATTPTAAGRSPRRSRAGAAAGVPGEGRRASGRAEAQRVDSTPRRPSAAREREPRCDGPADRADAGCRQARAVAPPGAPPRACRARALRPCTAARPRSPSGCAAR